MKYTLLIALVALFATACDAPAADRPEPGPAAELAMADVAAGEVVVYKSPTCGCCDGWIDHLRENGFRVRAVDLVQYDDMAAKKRQAGVPADLGSCHTAMVDGYAVEGHVPAHVIERLLRERPAVKGVAVPGMPIGSPGMEGPNPERYQVIAFEEDGSRSVFAEVDPTQPASDPR